MPTDNIIPFQPRPQPQPEKPFRQHPPFLNIPPFTKALAGILIFIHVTIFVLSYIWTPDIYAVIYTYGALIPVFWTNAEFLHWWTPFSLISFSFLHGGWLHLGVNTVLLVAIGSGLEKLVGNKRYMVIFFGSSLLAALIHIAIYPDSSIPIVGASGGISGLFGAIILLLNRDPQNPGLSNQKRLIPAVLVYIGITIIMGLLGAPDGSEVAWVAHIGGFISGLLLMGIFARNKKA